MTAPFHAQNRHTLQLAGDQLPGVAGDAAHRKARQLRVIEGDGFGHHLRQGAKPGAENQGRFRLKTRQARADDVGAGKSIFLIKHRILSFSGG